MSWSFLTQLLEEIHNHSTYVGKTWLMVFVVFRIVLTAVGGESIYYDEQSSFVCNSGQPGCQNVCYDAFAPLSHVRFWIFQTILVAAPSLFYLSYAVNKIAQQEEGKDGGIVSQRKNCKLYLMRQQHHGLEEAEEDQQEDPIVYEAAEVESRSDSAPQEHGGPKARHDGRLRIQRDGLMGAYVLQLLARSAFEVGFLYGQYTLYGLTMPPTYVCSVKPCPHTVDCFVSRPAEKTIFLLIMYGISVLSLLLNIYEMFHLAVGTVLDHFCSQRVSGQDEEKGQLTPLTGPPGMPVSEAGGGSAGNGSYPFSVPPKLTKPESVPFTELRSTAKNFPQSSSSAALHMEIRQAQENLMAAILAYSQQQQSQRGDTSKLQGQCKQQDHSRSKRRGGQGDLRGSISGKSDEGRPATLNV